MIITEGEYHLQRDEVSTIVNINHVKINTSTCLLVFRLLRWPYINSRLWNFTGGAGDRITDVD